MVVQQEHFGDFSWSNGESDTVSEEREREREREAVVQAANKTR